MIPTGGLLFTFDAAFLGAFAFEDVEGHVAQQREVFRRVTAADTALVLGEADIEAPVQGIFNRPVATHRPCEALGVRADAANVEASLDGDLALDFTDRFDHPDRAQFLPVPMVREPSNVRGNPVTTRFHTPMTAFAGFQKVMRDARETASCASSRKLLTSSCRVLWLPLSAST